VTHGQFIATVAREAGAVLKRRFGEGSAYSEKGRWDLVSDVDFEVEELIVSRIADAFPEDRIFSEEAGLGGNGGERLWIVDPLDGTANFIFGVPHFAVSVALEDEGQIVAGAVLNPVSDELYFSAGDRSYLNDRQIRCSERAELSEALVSVGVSMIPANLERILAEWRGLFERQRKGLALLSPALNICAVACGRTDVFIDFGSEMEGHAAAAFILQNAGGRVSNYDFTPWDHGSKGIIASNGELHGNLKEVTSSTWTN